MEGGLDLDDSNFPTKYQYLATIMYASHSRKKEKQYFRVKAMGTFYSKNGVLVSWTIAKNIQNRESQYKVQTSPLFGYISYSVGEVFYTQCSNTLHSKGCYGVIKTEDTEIPLTRHIHILEFNEQHFTQEANFHILGWTKDGETENIQLLPLMLMTNDYCQNYLQQNNRPHRKNEICLYPLQGYIQETDDGTPLYMGNVDGVLAITNTVFYHPVNFITCTLLSDKKTYLNKLLDVPKRGTVNENSEQELSESGGRTRNPDRQRRTRTGPRESPSLTAHGSEDTDLNQYSQHRSSEYFSRSRNPDRRKQSGPGESSSHDTSAVHESQSTDFGMDGSNLVLPRLKMTENPSSSTYNNVFPGIEDDFEKISIHQQSSTCKLPSKKAMGKLFSWKRSKET